MVGERFGRPFRQWQITVEGDTNVQDDDDPGDTNVKYTFNIEKDSDGSVKNSGTMEVANTGAAPAISVSLDGKFSVPGVGEVSCTKVSGGDEYTGSGAHKWNVTYEGARTTGGGGDTGDTNVKYTFLIEKSDDGITKHTGTMEVTNTGTSPSITVQVGGSFSVPGVGTVTCTKVSGGDTYTDSGAHKWTITYEGARVEAGSGGGSGDNPTLPESKEEITYEINGTTTRSVSGEFIVLRRSTTPVIKKSLTVYNNSALRLTTPGSAYADTDAVAVSETVAKEEQKVNGVTIGSYYRHEISLEV